jgi:hypothetical protein
MKKKEFPKNNRNPKIESYKNFSKNLVVKLRPVINFRKTWGYEVKLIDFASQWSREPGPEIFSKFFLREDDARSYAKELAGAA